MSNKPLEIHFLTLFPESLELPLKTSLLGKAQESGIVQYYFHQIRNFSEDKHRTVDDTPYGGGSGMVIRADVLFRAWEHALKSTSVAREKTRTLLMSPQGSVLNHKRSEAWARDFEKLILVCGHYEGLDERFIELCVDEEVSIGDYVLTGGEFPALVVTDVVVRRIQGVVGKEDSVSKDSLEGGLLKYPQYTKPREFEGKVVPEVLLSGNHAGN